MICTCKHRDDTLFPGAVQKALASLAALPGAISIVRNGGCEQTLRSLLLWPLESALKCIAFTEASGCRIDIVLCCLECGGNWAKIEMKSNFMHPMQLPGIEARTDRANAQLSGSPQATHAYYLHLFTQLIASEESAIRHAHNAPMLTPTKAMVTPYKHFLTPVNDGEAEHMPVGMAGDHLCESAAIIHPEDDQATAKVWCWGYRLIAGQFQNLVQRPQAPV